MDLNSKTKYKRIKDMTWGQRPGSQLSAEGNAVSDFSTPGGRKLGDILDFRMFVLEAEVGDQGLDRVIWTSHSSAAA